MPDSKRTTGRSRGYSMSAKVCSASPRWSWCSYDQRAGERTPLRRHAAPAIELGAPNRVFRLTTKSYGGACGKKSCRATSSRLAGRALRPPRWARFQARAISQSGSRRLPGTARHSRRESVCVVAVLAGTKHVLPVRLAAEDVLVVDAHRPIFQERVAEVP